MRMVGEEYAIMVCHHGLNIHRSLLVDVSSNSVTPLWFTGWFSLFGANTSCWEVIIMIHKVK